MIQQPYLPGIERELFKCYLDHERRVVSDFYIDLLNKGMEPIGKDAFCMQYVESGLAQRFSEEFGRYYGQVHMGENTVLVEEDDYIL